jgi:NAD(P)-dependent dehydrogenase (short-subunit alcohol dehydrogenase family)
MSDSLRGKAVVVTGAAQGLGRAYARDLCARGARVVVADLNEERASAVVGELVDAGGEALVAAVDVSDEASCRAMVTTSQEAFGPLHGLVNNAAIFSTLAMKPFWEITTEEWDQVQAVNVRGVWLVTKAVLPAIDESGGSIVNISSGVFWLGRPDYLHYVASKGAVIGMTRSMARELGGRNVRVNAVTPGPVYTEVPRGTVTPEQKAGMRERQCLARNADPNDLVGVVAFLLSDESRFVTGQTLNVDGGLAHH